MTETPNARARRLALTRVNGQGLSVAEWAAAVLACAHALHTSGITDEAVGSAAALARLLEPRPVTSELSEMLLQMARSGVAAIDAEALRASAREVCLLATHACLQRTSGTRQALLAGAERLLVPTSASPTGLEAELNRWTAAVVELGQHQPLQPHLKAAIASQQITLLRRTNRLLGTCVLHQSDPGGVERLRDGIDACSESWLRVGQAFKDESVSVPVTDASLAGAVRAAFAANQLRAALKRPEAAANETLETLLRTGFGGNLVAAIIVAEPGQRHGSRLLADAKRLEAVADPFTDVRFGPRFANPPVPGPDPSQGAAASTPPRAPLPLSVDRSTSRIVGHGVDVAPMVLTREVEAVLAARRDVGVLAQAALDGDPQARELTREVNVEQLARLVTDGREATAQMVASVIPAIHRAHRAMPRWLVADSVQDTAVALLEAARRWDPVKSRWLTFAIRNAGFTTTHSRRDSYKVPVPVSVTGDILHPDHSTSSAPPPEPEEALNGRLQDGERAHLMHQVRRLDPDVLAPSMLEVLLAYHGLDGHPARNFEEIAAEHSMSATTARRRYRAGIEILRLQLPTPVHATFGPRPEPVRAARRPGHGRSR